MTLDKLRQDTNKGTPRFKRYAYAEEDVRESLKKVVETDLSMFRRYSLWKKEQVVLKKKLKLINPNKQVNESKKNALIKRVNKISSLITGADYARRKIIFKLKEEMGDLI